MRAVLIFLGISIIFLSGCYDLREIDERSMILGLAIDKGEEKNS